MTTIQINVGGWPDCSGAKAKLYLVPGVENGGTPRVYSFGHVGEGMPEPAWHHRHLALGTVPLDTNADSLKAWLEGQTETLQAISALYQGSEWNGSNEVGRWHDDAEDAAHAFGEELQEALTYEAIERDDDDDDDDDESEAAL